MPSGHCSEAKPDAYSRVSQDSGVRWKRDWYEQLSHERLDMASTQQGERLTMRGQRTHTHTHTHTQTHTDSLTCAGWPVIQVEGERLWVAVLLLISFPLFLCFLLNFSFFLSSSQSFLSFLSLSAFTHLHLLLASSAFSVSFIHQSLSLSLSLFLLQTPSLSPSCLLSSPLFSQLQGLTSPHSVGFLPFFFLFVQFIRFLVQHLFASEGTSLALHLHSVWRIMAVLGRGPPFILANVIQQHFIKGVIIIISKALYS